LNAVRSLLEVEAPTLLMLPRLLTDWPPRGPKKVWSAVGGEGYSSCVVSSGRLYTMLREEGKEVVLCLDAATGDEKWRFRYDCAYQDGMGAGPRSTPTDRLSRLSIRIPTAGRTYCRRRKSHAHDAWRWWMI